MKTIIEKLASLANILDEQKLKAEADLLDGVIMSLAEITDRKFDILKHHTVKVPKQAYDSVQDPTEIPAKYQKEVAVKILVRRANEVQVFENDILEKIEFKITVGADKLNEAKARADSVADEFKRKYSPATADEVIEFIPV